MRRRLIRLGRTAAGRDVSLDPLAPAHVLLTGRTRAGKSVQLYGMLVQLRGLAVKVCGIDPSGIVFNAIREGLGGADLRVLTLRDPARARRVMAALVAEMDRRIDLLMRLRADRFTEYNTSLPLLIVVFEEYPGTLTALASIDQASGARPADRAETAIRAAVQRLALEGAKVGVVLWVVAQRADASLLSGVLRSQLSHRLSFASDPEGLRMLHEGITAEQVQAAQAFRPGDAYIETPGQPLVRYRTDFIEYAAFARMFDGEVRS